MCEHPAATAREKTILLGKLRHELATDYAANRDRVMIPGVMEEMVENFPNAVACGAELHNLRHAAGS